MRKRNNSYLPHRRRLHHRHHPFSIHHLTMLFAALGCNLAWGIIDGGMYLMARLGERGRNPLDALGFDRTSAMNARSLPNATKTSVQMRSRLCPQERQANPSIPDLSLADDPWLPQKDLGAFELALSSALPGRSLFDPPLSPFVDYQDRAISPRRDKDVRLNNIAALPSGETSHSCSSFSVLGRCPLTPSKSSAAVSPLPFAE
jgi:hypothetical protein